MKKKVLCAWALTLGMFCSVIFPAMAAELEYSDIKGHYAQSAIETWSGYGVLQGYPDGTFRPDGSITRAELATVLDRIMGYQGMAENTFSDLPTGKWYTKQLLRLVAEGILQGNTNGTMAPNTPVTRQEAFAILARAFELEESGAATNFTDNAAISGWAKGYIAAMQKAGYIQGEKNGALRPAAPLTRAELVTVLSKMVTAFVNADGTYSQNCDGNLIVNAQNVTLKDMTIEGDLLVADGVANGDVYLDKVTVKGNVVLRGCGQNSFHILSDSEVETIIVTKTAGGAIRVVNENSKAIPMVEVKDGVGGVILEGSLKEVEIASDVEVTFRTGTVETLSVAAADAKVNVEKSFQVSKAEIGATAVGTELTVAGQVASLVTKAAATVVNSGRISTVTAQADGLVLDGTKPGAVTIAKGVAAPVDANGNQVVAASTSSRSSSGGSTSASTSTPEPVPTPTPAPVPTPTPVPCKHTRVELVPEACKTATCSETGLSVVRCRDCGELIEQVIEHRNHKYGTWVYQYSDSNNAWQLWKATCTVCGEEAWAEVPTGTDPNKVTAEDGSGVYIPGLGEPEPKGCNVHLMEMVGDYVYNSCQSRSYTEVCKVCGVVSQVVENAHDAGWHIQVPISAQVDPTCTEEGLVARWRCERCGLEYPKDFGGPSGPAPTTIPALGHDWNEEGICTRCGEIRPEEALDDPAEVPLAALPQTEPDMRAGAVSVMAMAVLLLYGAAFVKKKRQGE